MSDSEPSLLRFHTADAIREERTKYTARQACREGVPSESVIYCRERRTEWLGLARARVRVCVCVCACVCVCTLAVVWWCLGNSSLRLNAPFVIRKKISRLSPCPENELAQVLARTVAPPNSEQGMTCVGRAGWHGL